MYFYSNYNRSHFGSSPYQQDQLPRYLPTMSDRFSDLQWHYARRDHYYRSSMQTNARWTCSHTRDLRNYDDVINDTPIDDDTKRELQEQQRQRNQAVIDAWYAGGDDDDETIDDDTPIVNDDDETMQEQQQSSSSNQDPKPTIKAKARPKCGPPKEGQQKQKWLGITVTPIKEQEQQQSSSSNQDPKLDH